jgi:hypothetical protein
MILLIVFVIGYWLGAQTVSWWLTSDPQRAIALIKEHTSPNRSSVDCELYVEQVNGKFHAYRVADNKFMKQGNSVELILSDLTAENPQTVFSIKE